MGYNMSFIGDLIGDITGATAAGQAAERGAATQAAAAGAGIEEQRRQFDKLVELMTPYITAGTGALTQQQALIGLGGPEAERAAIERISGGETFKALTAQGEEALLQKASATGGLRGGNIQAALSQFRPSILNALIEQQYGRLGGLTESGRLSAAGQGASGMTSASNISNLFANRAAATAGGQIAEGNVGRQMFGDVLGLATATIGAKNAKLF
jgi:hypothetical protein